VAVFAMARYEHLPIYREAMNFLLFCENAVRHFSRYNKYTQKKPSAKG
jgi:hypothetical protein